MLGCLLWPFRLIWNILTWPFRIIFGLFSPAPRRSAMLDVVGESHYQDNLRRVCGRPTAQGEDRWVSATLKPEPHNPHDPNAVVILIGNRPVGYLARDDARHWQPKLPARGLSVRAHITGGWQRGRSERGFYGVKIVSPG